MHLMILLFFCIYATLLLTLRDLFCFSVDFGVEHLIQIKDQTNFPWLMSNVIDKMTGKYLADGEKYHIMTWQDIKVQNLKKEHIPYKKHTYTHT